MLSFFSCRVFPLVKITMLVFVIIGQSAQAQTAQALVGKSEEKTEAERGQIPLSVPNNSPEFLTIAQSGIETEDLEIAAPQSPVSYLGIGGNLALSGGETALGDGGFAVVSKVALTRNLSFHNSTIIEEDPVSIFALTYGVPIEAIDDPVLEEIVVAPFVFAGGGLMVPIGEFDLDFVLTAGVDFPVSPDLTGTFRFNVGFPEDETDLGLILGLGYNFNISLF